MSAITKGQLLLARKVYEFKSLRPCNLTCTTRQEIRNYFENSYDLDESIFSSLIDETYFYKCPDRLRLPLIFYLAHTATLYVNKLLLCGLIEQRVDRNLETLFETGVDEMSWDDTENYRMGGTFQWPSVSVVLDYREKVRELVINVIEKAPLKLPITMDHPWWALFLGMEHQRIHLETSSVLLRQLPVEYLQCPTNWRYGPYTADTPAGTNDFVKVSEGDVTLGKPEDYPTYGWDNEYGKTTQRVPAFEATKYKVMNKEFLDFVEAGGYENRGLWTDEGWKWVQFREAKHPSFWVCHRGCKSGCGADLSTYSHCNIAAPSSNEVQYRYRVMFDVIDMPWEWPVEVNYHEAKAYCHWRGAEYRLPTEAEHERMSGFEAPTSEFDCDPISTGETKANINFEYGSSTPVNFYPPSSLGFYDVYGNVWEWMEDHFNGLPGFKTNFIYDDFSAPCFDGRHTMMQGGSWISTGDEASRFARFAFRRHFYQHMGFRLVRPLTSEVIPVRLCGCDVFILGAGTTDNPVLVPGVEEKQCVVTTTNCHFEYDKLPICQTVLEQTMGKDVDYGKPLALYCEQLIAAHNLATSSAIVFGCGPGYTCFHLAKTFDEVMGVEYSGRLLDAAEQFLSKGYVQWNGTTKTPLSDKVERRNNVKFKQLTWIPNEIQSYNFILFEFLDRLMEPKGWLLKLWECLVPGGVLVISANSEWTSDVLREYIGRWFDLIDETEICNKRVTTWCLTTSN